MTRGGRGAGPERLAQGEPALEPEIRAAYLKLYLDASAALGEDLALAVRAGAGPDAVRRIERARGAEWAPVAWEIAMLRAVHARGGDAAVLALCREAARRARRSTAFRPLLAAMLAMFGSRPEVLVRFACASWDVAMRNAGRPGGVTAVGRRVIRLAHEEIPARSWDRLLALRICGHIEALLEHRGVMPRAEADWTPGSSRAVYTIVWP